MLDKIVRKDLMSQNNANSGVCNQIRKTLSRIVEIEADKSAARFQNSQHPHNRLHRALEVESDHLFWLNPQFQQPVGDLVSAAIEFVIRQIFSLPYQGDRIGCLLRLIFDTTMDQRLRLLLTDLAPCLQFHALGRCQHRQFG